MKAVLHGLVGVLLALLGLELLLQALPVSTSTRTGYHTDSALLTYPPHHRWTMATGWDLKNVQRMQANNLGFAAEHNFIHNPHAVALIGDSYVESSMLNMADRPAAQLQRALGGTVVYAMGGPGSSLLDYAERVRYGYQHLGIRRFVVLMEHADASQSVCGSGNIHARCVDPQTLQAQTVTQPPAGFAKKVLRESALAQYLTSQLKFSPQTVLNPTFWAPGTADHGDAAATAASRPQGVSAEKRRLAEAAVRLFLERIAPYTDATFTFAVDMDRSQLGLSVPTADESDLVVQMLQAAGHPVVPAKPIFIKHASQSPFKLAVGPYDGHLNPLGIQLLVGGLAQAMVPHTTTHTN